MQNIPKNTSDSGATIVMPITRGPIREGVVGGVNGKQTSLVTSQSGADAAGRAASGESGPERDGIARFDKTAIVCNRDANCSGNAGSSSLARNVLPPMR